MSEILPRSSAFSKTGSVARSSDATSARLSSVAGGSHNNNNKTGESGGAQQHIVDTDSRLKWLDQRLAATFQCRIPLTPINSPSPSQTMDIGAPTLPVVDTRKVFNDDEVRRDVTAFLDSDSVSALYAFTVAPLTAGITRSDGTTVTIGEREGSGEEIKKLPPPTLSLVLTANPKAEDLTRRGVRKILVIKKNANVKNVSTEGINTELSFMEVHPLAVLQTVNHMIRDVFRPLIVSHGTDRERMMRLKQLELEKMRKAREEERLKRRQLLIEEKERMEREEQTHGEEAAAGGDYSSLDLDQKKMSKMNNDDFGSIRRITSSAAAMKGSQYKHAGSATSLVAVGVSENESLATLAAAEVAVDEAPRSGTDTKSVRKHALAALATIADSSLTAQGRQQGLCRLPLPMQLHRDQSVNIGTPSQQNAREVERLVHIWVEEFKAVLSTACPQPQPPSLYVSQRLSKLSLAKSKVLGDGSEAKKGFEEQPFSSSISGGIDGEEGDHYNHGNDENGDAIGQEGAVVDSVGKNSDTLGSTNKKTNKSNVEYEGEVVEYEDGLARNAAGQPPSLDHPQIYIGDVPPHIMPLGILYPLEELHHWQLHHQKVSHLVRDIIQNNPSFTRCRTILEENESVYKGVLDTYVAQLEEHLVFVEENVIRWLEPLVPYFQALTPVSGKTSLSFGTTAALGVLPTHTTPSAISAFTLSPSSSSTGDKTLMMGGVTSTITPQQQVYFTAKVKNSRFPSPAANAEERAELDEAKAKKGGGQKSKKMYPHMPIDQLIKTNYIGELFELLYLMWEHNESYPTSARVASLMVGIAECMIVSCHEYLNLGDRFISDTSAETIARIRDVFAAGAKIKSAAIWFKHKATAVGRESIVADKIEFETNHKNSSIGVRQQQLLQQEGAVITSGTKVWDVSHTQILAHLDQFLERCNDIAEVLETRDLYVRLKTFDMAGVEGNALYDTICGFADKFEEELQVGYVNEGALEALPHPSMKFDELTRDHLLKFARELETKISEGIHSYVSSAPMDSNLVRNVIGLQCVLERPASRTQQVSIIADLVKRWCKEMKTVKTILKEASVPVVEGYTAFSEEPQFEQQQQRTAYRSAAAKTRVVLGVTQAQTTMFALSLCRRLNDLSVAMETLISRPAVQSLPGQEASFRAAFLLREEVHERAFAAFEDAFTLWAKGLPEVITHLSSNLLKYIPNNNNNNNNTSTTNHFAARSNNNEGESSSPTPSMARRGQQYAVAGKTFEVSLDPEVALAMREVSIINTILVQPQVRSLFPNLSMPAEALELLNMKEKLWENHAQLCNNIEKFNEIRKSIVAHEKVLFSAEIEAVNKIFMRGVNGLIWDSLANAEAITSNTFFFGEDNSKAKEKNLSSHSSYSSADVITVFNESCAAALTSLENSLKNVRAHVDELSVLLKALRGDELHFLPLLNSRIGDKTLTISDLQNKYTETHTKRVAAIEAARLCLSTLSSRALQTLNSTECPSAFAPENNSNRRSPTTPKNNTSFGRSPPPQGLKAEEGAKNDEKVSVELSSSPSTSGGATRRMPITEDHPDWRLFIGYVDTLVASEIREFLSYCLQTLRRQLDPKWLRENDGIPLLHSQLFVDEREGIRVTPDLHTEIHLALLKMKEDPFALISSDTQRSKNNNNNNSNHSVPQPVVSYFMPTQARQEALNNAIRRDLIISKRDGMIQRALEDTWKAVGAQVASLAKFEELYQPTRKRDILEKLSAGNSPVYKVSLSRVAEQAMFYRQLRQRVDSSLPSICVIVGWIRLDFRGAKETLKRNAIECMQMCVAHVQSSIRLALDNVKSISEKASAVFDEDLQYVDGGGGDKFGGDDSNEDANSAAAEAANSSKRVFQLIQNIKTQDASVRAIFQPITAGLRQLQEWGTISSVEHEALYEEVGIREPEWIATVNNSIGVKEQLASVFDREVESLRERVKAFERRVEAEREELLASSIFTASTVSLMGEDPYEGLDAARKHWVGVIKATADELLSEQKLFEAEFSTLDLVAKTILDIQHCKQFWDCAFLAACHCDEWLAKPFASVDTVLLVEQTRNISRYFSLGLPREAKQWKCFAAAERRLNKITSSIPLIQDLRTSALRKRHWDQLLHLCENASSASVGFVGADNVSSSLSKPRSFVRYNSNKRISQRNLKGENATMSQNQQQQKVLFDPLGPTTTLGDLLNLNLHYHGEAVAKLVERAEKEMQIENLLLRMQSYWAKAKLPQVRNPFYASAASSSRRSRRLEQEETTHQIAQTSQWILGSADTIREMLEEHINLVLSAIASKWGDYFKPTSQKLYVNLSNLDCVISSWLESQKLWTSLFPIFDRSDDLKRAIPEDALAFMTVTKIFHRIFKFVFSSSFTLGSEKAKLRTEHREGGVDVRIGPSLFKLLLPQSDEELKEISPADLEDLRLMGEDGKLFLTQLARNHGRRLRDLESSSDVPAEDDYVHGSGQQRVGEGMWHSTSVSPQPPSMVQATIGFQLEVLAFVLERCNLGLAKYLEQKRRVFPRLFFLSDADLITIFANSEFPPIVTKFIGKLCLAVDKCIFSDNEFNALSPDEREVLALEGEKQNKRRERKQHKALKEANKSANFVFGAEPSSSSSSSAYSSSAALSPVESDRGDESDESDSQQQQHTHQYQKEEENNSHNPLWRRRDTITAVVSIEGEELQLPIPFICVGPVEVWLSGLIDAIKNAVRAAVVFANAHYIEVSRQQWMFEHIAQAVCLVARAHWTSQSAAALEAVEDGNLSALNDHANALKQQLAYTIGETGTSASSLASASSSSGTTATTPTSSRVVGGTVLSALQRKTLFTLITIDVHARDIIGELIAKKVDSSMSFSWLKVLRFYFENSQQHVAMASPLKRRGVRRSGPQHGGDSSLLLSQTAGTFDHLSPRELEQEIQHVITQMESTPNLAVGHINDASFAHGFEYTGNCGCLVVTPLTDRCYITLTQALKLYKGGAPAGPAGTGKTETVKDIARTLGYPVYVFNCSEQMDLQSIGGIFKGLATSGAWGCFDEFNRIAIEVLSVVAAQVKSVLDACATKSSHFTILDSTLPLNPSVGIFITMNPGYKGRTELPENVKSLFRPCAMVVPDLENICEIYLNAEGFLNATELSRKFVRLYQLNKELLSPQTHYDWGLRAIRAVLSLAGTMRRSLPSHIDERSIFLTAVREANLAKLVKADLVMFNWLLASLFPNVKETRARDMSTEMAVKSATQSLGYTLGENNVVITKVNQLFELLNVRHSVIVLGPAGSGKSSLISIAQRALEHKIENSSSAGAPASQAQSPFSASVATSSTRAVVTVEAFDPKVVSSHELYGYIQPQTREWRDGILSRIFRDFATNPAHRRNERQTTSAVGSSGMVPVPPPAQKEDRSPSSARRRKSTNESKSPSKPSHANVSFGLMSEPTSSSSSNFLDCSHQWIVLDGEIDAEWIESMNSVMDDNKLLTLANNDRIPMTESMRLIFEVTNLANATPATVSRAGILHIEATDIGWAPMKERWLYGLATAAVKTKFPSSPSSAGKETSRRRRGNSSNDNIVAVVGSNSSRNKNASGPIPEQLRTHIDILFDRYVPIFLNYVSGTTGTSSIKTIIPVGEITYVRSLCDLLEALLSPQTSPFGLNAAGMPIDLSATINVSSPSPSPPYTTANTNTTDTTTAAPQRMKSAPFPSSSSVAAAAGSPSRSARSARTVTIFEGGGGGGAKNKNNNTTTTAGGGGASKTIGTTAAGGDHSANTTDSNFTERVFVWACVWVFGSSIAYAQTSIVDYRLNFSKFVKREFGAILGMPDDGDKTTVFDWCLVPRAYATAKAGGRGGLPASNTTDQPANSTNTTASSILVASSQKNNNKSSSSSAGSKKRSSVAGTGAAATATSISFVWQRWFDPETTYPALAMLRNGARFVTSNSSSNNNNGGVEGTFFRSIEQAGTTDSRGSADDLDPLSPLYVGHQNKNSDGTSSSSIECAGTDVNALVYNGYIAPYGAQDSAVTHLNEMFQFVNDPSIPLSEVVIPNEDTERHVYFTNLLVKAGKNVLLVGNAGTGKSALVKYLSSKAREAAAISAELLSAATPTPDVTTCQKFAQHASRMMYVSRDEYEFSTMHLSGYSDSATIQSKLEENLEKRVGSQYGPRSRKRLIVVIENLNMPLPDKYGSHSALNLIRQHIDRGFWYDREKLQVPKTTIDQQYIATMDPNVGSQTRISERLLGKFFPIGVGHGPLLGDSSASSAASSGAGTIVTTFSALLRLCLEARGVSSLDPNVSSSTRLAASMLLNAVPSAIELWATIAKRFLPTAKSFHYSFTMRDMARFVQGLVCIDPSTCEPVGKTKLSSSNSISSRGGAKGGGIGSVAMMWLFQLRSVFCDRLSNLSDYNEALRMISSKARQLFSAEAGGGGAGGINLDGTAIPYAPFENIFEDVEGAYPPIPRFGTPTTDTESVLDILHKREEILELPPSSIIFFDQAIENIVRVSRVISQPGGNAFIIGTSGSGKRQLALMACRLCLFTHYPLRSLSAGAGSVSAGDITSAKNNSSSAQKDVFSEIAQAVVRCVLKQERIAFVISPVSDGLFSSSSAASSSLSYSEASTAAPAAVFMAAIDEFLSVHHFDNVLDVDTKNEIMTRMSNELRILGAGGGEVQVVKNGSDNMNLELGTAAATAKTNHDHQDPDACHHRYVSKLTNNLRIIITASADNVDSLRFYMRRFPSLQTTMQIIFFHEWPEEALMKVAESALTTTNENKNNKKKMENNKNRVVKSNVSNAGADREDRKSDALSKRGEEMKLAADQHHVHRIDFSNATEALVRRKPPPILGDTPPNSPTKLMSSSSSRKSNVLVGNGVKNIGCEPDTLAPDALKLAICYHLSRVHILASSFCDKISRAYSKDVRVTPKTFLTAVETTERLILKKRSDFEWRQTRLTVGLEQLQRCREATDTLSAELKIAKVQAEDQALKTQALLERVEVDRSIVEQQNEFAAKESERTNKIHVEVNELVAECEADLVAAQPMIAAALAALKTLNKSNLTELKSMTSPPPDVAEVTGCVMCLLSKPPHVPLDRTWAASRRMMADVPRWMAAMENIDFNNIPQECVDAIWKTVHQPHFDDELIKSKSFAASSLCRWVKKVVEYHKVRMIVKPKEDRLTSAQARLVISKTALQRVQKKVAVLKARLDEIISQYDAAMDEKTRLEYVLKTTAMKMQRAQRLLVSLGSEKSRWVDSLRYLDADRSFVDGDAIIAASFVVYAGPLMSEVRGEFMTLVKKIVDKNPFYAIPFTRRVRKPFVPPPPPPPPPAQSPQKETGEERAEDAAADTGKTIEGSSRTEIFSSNEQQQTPQPQPTINSNKTSELFSAPHQQVAQPSSVVEDDSEDNYMGELNPVNTLFSPIDFATWASEGLPETNRMIENAVIALSHSMWPLFVDPENQGLRWIQGRAQRLAEAKTQRAEDQPQLREENEEEEERGIPEEVKNQQHGKLSPNSSLFVVVRQTDKGFIDTILQAVEQGAMTLVDDIVPEIGIDSSLQPLLDLAKRQHPHIHIGSKREGGGAAEDPVEENQIVTLTLADKEVTVHPSFYIFFRTTVASPKFNPDIFSRVAIVDFTVTEQGLQELLLSTVVARERPDLESTRTTLSLETNRMTLSLLECEEVLLEELATAALTPDETEEANAKEKVDGPGAGHDVEERVNDTANNLTSRPVHVPHPSAGKKKDILQNETLVQTLEAAKEQSIRMKEALREADITQQLLSSALATYTPIAARGALVYMCLSQLSRVNEMYKYSIDNFFDQFIRAIVKGQEFCLALGLGASPQQQQPRQNPTDSSGTNKSISPTSSNRTTNTGNIAGNGSSSAKNKFEVDRENDSAVSQQLQQRIEVLVISVTKGLFAYTSRSLYSRHKIVLAAALTFAIGVRNGTIPQSYMDFLLHRSISSAAASSSAGNGEQGMDKNAIKSEVQGKASRGSISVMGNTTHQADEHEREVGGIGRQGGSETRENEMPQNLVEWMSLEQWDSLIALSHIQGPIIPFSRLIEECTDSLRWRIWCSQRSPETERLPSDWRQLAAIEKLMIIRALRNDRMIHATKNYIAETMGRFLLDDYDLQLSEVLVETPQKSPILFILSAGTDPSRAVAIAAGKHGISELSGELLTISMGQGQEELAENVIIRAAKEGKWVLLQNVHLMRTWIKRLDRLVLSLFSNDKALVAATLNGQNEKKNSFVSETSKRLVTFPSGVVAAARKGNALPIPQLPVDQVVSVHSKFRLFMTSGAVEYFPTALLQSSTKLVDEPPAGLKANFTRAYALFSHEPWQNSTKPQEYHALVYSLCFFHAAILERSKFGPAGWNRQYPFNFEDLLVCTNVLGGYLEDRPRVPWEDLQYIFGQIMYGGHITDLRDSRLCMTLLHKLVSPDLIEGPPGRVISSSDGGASSIVMPLTRSHSETMAMINETLTSEGPSMLFMNSLSENRARSTESNQMFSFLFDVLPKPAQQPNPPSRRRRQLKRNQRGRRLGINFDDEDSENRDEDDDDLSDEDIETTIKRYFAVGGDTSGGLDEKDIDTLHQQDRLAMLLGAVPEAIQTVDIGERLGRDMTPYQHVFYRECERLNILTHTMRTMLDEADSALKGIVPMTAETEVFLSDIRHDRVPSQWLARWGETKRPLAGWLALISDASTQLFLWAMDYMTPKAVNLQCFFIPIAFLTAIQQEASLRMNIELDQLDLIVEVTKKTPAQVDLYPRDGCFVYGPSLEGGAVWDSNQNCLAEAAGTRDSSLMPVVIVRCAHVSRIDRSDSYACPLYATTTRGASFITTLYLKTRVPASEWVLRGTALVLDGAY